MAPEAAAIAQHRDSAPPSRASSAPPSAPRGAFDDDDGTPLRKADPARLRSLVDTYYDFVWRSVRRLGVVGADVDDATQQVFWVVARKLDDIELGAERSFLFGTAMRVASDARRSRQRRREVPEEAGGPEPRDAAPNPEEVADRRRARALLDEALDALPMDLRAVFVLYELEEVGVPEIAVMLGLPVGTASSRLRRAREEFQRIAARMRARADWRGGAA